MSYKPASTKAISDQAISNKIATCWHHGELTMQQHAGTEQQMAEIGPRFVRQCMPAQHRDFFQSLSMLFIAYKEQRTISVASLLFGDPGFIDSPSETVLLINTQHTLGDLFSDNFNVGDRIGLLGIEFATKRRNRVNAIVTEISQKTIRVQVLQSYGNCPKYIQPKNFVSNRYYGKFSAEFAEQLSQHDHQLINNADSFFIATHFDDGQQLNNRGADISHRGGRKGFVSINSDGQLLVEDYIGNGFFNTLGNLLNNPIASLLFCDWVNGQVLRLTVTSEIIWHDLTVKNENQRSVHFTPIKIERLNNALAYRVDS